jgi:hypothetical protein
MQHIAGSSNPLSLVARKVVSTSDTVVIEVEGPYALVEALQPAYGDGHDAFDRCPVGYTVANSDLSPDGRGGGRLSVTCVLYGNATGSGFAPTKTVFTIDMVETVKQLENHPSLAADIAKIKLWLASSPGVQYSGTSGYSYTDADGETQGIESGSAAYKFCAAYAAGITTYSEYYPVITKVSIWTTLQGVSISGNSMTGGNVSQFSADIGKWDTPPLTLNGFASTNWFKNGDRWQQNQDQTYTRQEQWTYTPEGSNGPHGWIYAVASASSGGGNS